MRRICLLIAIGMYSFVVSGQEIPSPPDPPRLVNDFSSVLTRNEQATLERELVNFANETSTQIVIVTVKTLDGYAISDYAFRLGEKWGIGQEGRNNGALIVIKPKTSRERGEAFLATGYGLEHLIPDAVANRIVDHEMIPGFEKNDYYGGLSAGVKVVMKLTRGEYTAEAYTEQVQSQQDGSPLFFLFFLLFFVIVPILRGRRRGYYSSGRSNLPLWIALGMMGSQHRNHTGSFGNFTSGSGGFGGFGGFGGGSFGGGGAGGSW
jgi:uncharacterized protein